MEGSRNYGAALDVVVQRSGPRRAATHGPPRRAATHGPYNTYNNQNILKIPIIYSQAQADRWNYRMETFGVHFLLNEMSSGKNNAK